LGASACPFFLRCIALSCQAKAHYFLLHYESNPQTLLNLGLLIVLLSSLRIQINARYMKSNWQMVSSASDRAIVIKAVLSEENKL
jgi:hypothetical protein